jgi:hypothetical protein
MFAINPMGRSFIDSFLSFKNQAVEDVREKFLPVSNTLNRVVPGLENRVSVKDSARRFGTSGNLAAVFLLALLACDSEQEKTVKINGVLNKKGKDLKEEDFLILVDGLEGGILVVEIVGFLNKLTKDQTLGFSIHSKIFSDRMSRTVMSIECNKYPSADVESLKSWVNNTRSNYIRTRCANADKTCMPSLGWQSPFY